MGNASAARLNSKDLAVARGTHEEILHGLPAV
jgi:hypothetical protein